MAIIVVLVGQCGNQLGDELFTQLAHCTGLSAAPTAHSSTPAPSPFFTRDGIARCVLVDTEPKVVLGVRQRHSTYIRTENVIHGQSGRGNNWGLGYNGVRTAHSRRTEENAAVQRAFRNMGRDQRAADDDVLAKALQAIHRETRRTGDTADGDDFEAILVLHSLVGGTGSGLASRLSERLRLYFIEPPPGETVDEVYEAKMMRLDDFDGGLHGEARRARHLVNIAVAPQVLGEVATQGLNSCLTLQVLQRHADAVLLLRNDDAMAPGVAGSGSICGGTSVLSRCATFKEANEVLVALLLPVLRYGMEPGCIAALVRQCVPPSSFARTTGGNKLLSVMPTPQPTYGAVRHCVHRAFFFPITGGRPWMPGYQPTVPVEELLSETALHLWRGRRQQQRQQPLREQRAPGVTVRRGTTHTNNKTVTTPRQGVIPPQRVGRSGETSLYDPELDKAELSGSQTRLGGVRRSNGSLSGGNERGLTTQRRVSSLRRESLGFRTPERASNSQPAASSAEGPFASTSASARRRPPVTPFSSANEGIVRHAGRSQSQHAPGPGASTSFTSTSSHSLGRPEPAGHRGSDAHSRGLHNRDSLAECDDGPMEGDEDSQEEALARRVYHQRTTRIAPRLYQHYQQLRRAPVTKMFETIDGVLVMNEALELNRSLLFPLLRSAAMKVRSGAFMSAYEDVGVTSDRVKRAIREVAEVMANAEEL